jgi:hypothetical protein
MDPVTPINPDQPPIPQTPTIPPTVSKSSGLINPSSMYHSHDAGNLINPVAVVDIRDAKGAWKFWMLDGLSIIGAALFGYAFARYLIGGLSFWFTLAALFFWGTLSVLEGFLQKKLSRRALVIFLEAIALIPFFTTYDWTALIFAEVIVLICLFWGYLSVRRSLRNSIEVRFFSASGRVMGKLITAAIVFMIIMYAALINDNGGFFVSQRSFNTFFGWASGFVNNFYPTVPLNGSLGDFTQAIARIQLQSNPAFQSLTPTQRDQALAESANQLAGAFVGSSASSTAPAPVASTTLDQPTSNAFYGYLERQMERLQNKVGSAFVGLWGLILFLILRSVGIIVVWIAQLVALVFYEILIATGFMKIVEHPATQEVVEC